MSRKYSDECKNKAKEVFIYFEQLCIGEIYTTTKEKKNFHYTYTTFISEDHIMLKETVFKNSLAYFRGLRL